MKFILVFQWPASSEADFDDLLSMENELENALGAHGFVDGHDFGSGETNIFVETDTPADAFADAAKALNERPRWSEVRAAFRDATDETYNILWSHSLHEFSVK